MRNRWQVYIGILITAIGLLSLIGVLFDVDVGAMCWPVVLIALGVWLLVRPRLVGPGTAVQFRLLGDVRRYGDWPVSDEEIWLGVGDVRLDMTGATIPVGETRIRIFSFVGDVRLVVPEGVGISVSSLAFLTDSRMLGQERDTFFGSFHLSSDDYAVVERRVQLEMNAFVANIRVSRALDNTASNP